MGDKKAYDKQYRVGHKEEAKLYFAKYYKENKEAMNARIICDICNNPYTKSCKYAHFRTKNHKIGELMKELELYRIAK